jgi:hypothetical protein
MISNTIQERFIEHVESKNKKSLSTIHKHNKIED